MTNKKDTIVICLVGKSGSGKTTIASHLWSECGFNIIHSYTTRPPRHDNEWGHEFIHDWHTIYNNKGELQGVCPIKKGTMLTSGKTETQCIYVDQMIAKLKAYNNTLYFATDKQIKRGRVNVYVVDYNGALQVEEYYKDNDTVSVIPIFLYIDHETQKQRLEHRLKSHNINYSEQHYKTHVTERLLSDTQLFPDVVPDTWFVIDGTLEIEDIIIQIQSILRQLNMCDKTSSPTLLWKVCSMIGLSIMIIQLYCMLMY